MNNDTFDMKAYVDALIAALGYDAEAPEKRARLAELLTGRVSRLILSTASTHVSNETVQSVLLEVGDRDDMDLFMEKVIEYSPAAQKAIARALDDFFQETLDVKAALKL